MHPPSELTQQILPNFYPTLPNFYPTLPNFTQLLPNFTQLLPNFYPTYPTFTQLLPNFTQLLPNFYPNLPNPKFFSRLRREKGYPTQNFLPNCTPPGKVNCYAPVPTHHDAQGVATKKAQSCPYPPIPIPVPLRPTNCSVLLNGVKPGQTHNGIGGN